MSTWNWTPEETEHTTQPAPQTELTTYRQAESTATRHHIPVRNKSSNRYRIDIGIENSSILRTIYDRFDAELRPIDVIDRTVKFDLE